MKPSWDDAPEGFDWLAQDRSGLWFWYSVKPELETMTWHVKYARDMKPATRWADNWRETLEKRP